jgi:hypothetical protein
MAVTPGQSPRLITTQPFFHKVKHRMNRADDITDITEMNSLFGQLA